MLFDEADLPLDTVRIPVRENRFRAVINLDEEGPLAVGCTESKVAIGPERSAPDNNAVAVLAQKLTGDAQAMRSNAKVNEELRNTQAVTVMSFTDRRECARRGSRQCLVFVQDAVTLERQLVVVL